MRSTFAERQARKAAARGISRMPPHSLEIEEMERDAAETKRLRHRVEELTAGRARLAAEAYAAGVAAATKTKEKEA